MVGLLIAPQSICFICLTKKVEFKSAVDAWKKIL